MIQSAIGPIALRAPTEIEAIRFEDRHRASRRKAADGEVVEGALYDNGLEEVLACVTSHKAAELHPADDGLLSDSPGVYERLCDEFRRLGGGALSLCDSPDAITEDIRLSYGRKALGFEYGGIKLVLRTMRRRQLGCAFIVNVVALINSSRCCQRTPSRRPHLRISRTRCASTRAWMSRNCPGSPKVNFRSRMVPHNLPSSC